MDRFIFVCTGNTCRSPLAESYARMKYPDKDISSRGLFVTNSTPNSRSLAIIKDNSLPVPSLPEQLTAADIEKGKLLVMGRNHKEAILARWPKADVQLLSDFAGCGETDIPDPYGGTETQYKDVFVHLKKYIDKFQW